MRQDGSAAKRVGGARCSATTRAGKPCGAPAGSDGLCSAHRDPERMRELGRKGGKGRKVIDPARVNEGLRSYLKREADPSRVWEAIQRALEGSNEAARVSASKLLLDALYEPAVDACPACAERETNAERVEAKLLDLLARTGDVQDA
jgi:general stress protein YciG